ncbi:MAG: glycoside hydrolase family 43 protein [Bacteroidales bacterium]|nr:glycoside hydrolase family 43 protein [Bacteroidales bacterium]
MKKRIIIRLCFLFISSTVLLFSCNTKENKTPPEGYAAFDWFEYQGYDPIYESLEPGPDEYLNPLLAGFYPDPSIVRVKEDYYLIHSSFSYYPGIPVFHSEDLVNWTQIGHVLNRPSQLNLDNLGISRGIFAPAISYNQGTFYIVCTVVDGIGNFVVTAKDPAGPWSDPAVLSFDGIDPSLFFDEDGRAYLVNNGSPDGEPLYDGHRAIWFQEFNKDSLKLIGPRKIIVNGGVDIREKPVWIEGPHLFRANGYYYLIAAEGGTGVNHSEVAFRSENVQGPYLPWIKNPILTQRHLDPKRPHPVTCTGHADIVKTQYGEWWAVFLACTPYKDDFYNTGRQTFLLPVTWINGWPSILAGENHVPYSHTKPMLQEQPKAMIPLNGNFTYRDDFADTSLAMIYNMIRTPREKWYYFEDGKLMIKARNEAIDDISQPSFVGRRQQHNYCSVIASLQYNPQNEGDKAGMVAFQNEKHYYFLGLKHIADSLCVVLETGSSEGPKEITLSKSNINENTAVYLKIDARGKYYDFYYATEPDKWILVMEDADATILSTHKAGGFVGAYFGLYACAAEDL